MSGIFLVMRVGVAPGLLEFSIMLPRVLEFSGNIEEVTSGSTVC